MELFERSRRLQDRMVAFRRRLHACPEIGFDLQQTRNIIKEELTRSSLSFRDVGRGAIVGEIGKGTGDFVLLRAEADGLPIREETDLSFRSENGAMHACGHDLHCAALLGALTLLKERENDLPRRVRFLFQPAEELLSGAKDAVKNGVCEGVTTAGMLHVTVGSGLPTGAVILPPEGVIAPCAAFFSVALQGKGCHGADPSSGASPLIPAIRLAEVLSDVIRGFPTVVHPLLTVSGVQCGDSFNVIPDRVHLKGSLRCFDCDVLEKMKKCVSSVTAEISVKYGVRASVEFPYSCPSLRNDPILRRRMKIALENVLGNGVLPVDRLSGSSGSEDFAVIADAVPSLMLALSAGNSPFPLHHPKVVFDEGCLPYGAAALAAFVGCE